ncbi:MAG: ABC-2 type transport system ATP-binding protein [Paraglaciecola sp.]|jgi:ABC-2 type transport system ATP-binding protein
MIISDKVCKTYTGFEALKNVSFDIKQGDIVGILGKNGAGKTSLMRILTSFLPATSGKVIIDGQDLAKHSLAIRQKIGYLPETPPLYTNMTVQSYLKFAAQIKDVAINQQRRQLHKVLDECQLEGVRNQAIHTLSKGFKQRVGIAQAIIHEPKILILDEPTSGLDPIQIRQVRALIKNQQGQRTVLVSTHTLSEIENIAERVLIIKSGVVIVDETLHTLLQPKDTASSSAQSLEAVFLSLHPESLISDQAVSTDLLQEKADA